MVYTKGNWFVIPLSCIYFGNWVTEMPNSSQNNNEQLRTLLDLSIYFVSNFRTLYIHYKLEIDSQSPNRVTLSHGVVLQQKSFYTLP